MIHLFDAYFPDYFPDRAGKDKARQPAGKRDNLTFCKQPAAKIFRFL
jgi:hypothetical protein